MAYSYYAQITIDHTKVADDLVDFPFLFNTTSADLKTVANGGHIENTALGGTSGSLTVPADLVFSPNQNGSSKYDFEVEKYDPVTGELVAHVRMPSLSSSEDTVFYVCYGDPGVTISQENVTGVWDSSFKGVWHLAEASGTQYDSTINNNDGTPSGTTQVDGKIGKARSFNGSSDYIDGGTGSTLNPTSAISVEAWLKANDIIGQIYPPIVKKSSPSGGYGLEINHTNSTAKFWLYVAGVGWTGSPASSALSIGQWYHGVGTYDGSSVRLYINGAQVGSGTSQAGTCLLYTSPSPRDGLLSRMPSSA